MILFSAGNTWEDSFLDRIIELNQEHTETRVQELFGSVAGLTPTARSKDRIPEKTLDDLSLFISKAERSGIHIRWTLNHNCVGSIQSFYEDWSAIRGMLRWLYNRGVVRFVISHPLIMELVRKTLPHAHLEVSTIAEVESVEQLKDWKRLGADSVCGKHELNRDFRALKALIKTAHSLGMAYKVMATEACIHGPCVMRDACYAASSHNSTREHFEHWPFGRCNLIRSEDPSQLIKTKFILPQWIPYYAELGVDSFKITGRTLPSPMVLPIIEKYMDLHWEGNLLDILPGYAHLSGEIAQELYISCKVLNREEFVQYFVKYGYLCASKSCEECGYCLKVYEKCGGDM